MERPYGTITPKKIGIKIAPVKSNIRIFMYLPMFSALNSIIIILFLYKLSGLGYEVDYVVEEYNKKCCHNTGYHYVPDHTRESKLILFKH